MPHLAVQLIQSKCLLSSIRLLRLMLNLVDSLKLPVLWHLPRSFSIRTNDNTLPVRECEAETRVVEFPNRNKGVTDLWRVKNLRKAQLRGVSTIGYVDDKLAIST